MKDQEHQEPSFPGEEYVYSDGFGVQARGAFNSIQKSEDLEDAAQFVIKTAMDTSNPWASFVYNRQTYTNETFRDFIESPFPKGLNAVSHDKRGKPMPWRRGLEQALSNITGTFPFNGTTYQLGIDLFKAAMGIEHGGTREGAGGINQYNKGEMIKRNIVTLDHPATEKTDNTERGNSVAYTRQRLAKQHPELYAQVADGSMSANAAAIQAGFRKQPTPFDIVKRNWPKLTAEQQADIININT